MNDGSKQTTRIYAWIAEDLNGIEGIVAYPTEYGFMPLLSTEVSAARSFAPQAQEAARQRKSQARLIAFDRTEVILP